MPEYPKLLDLKLQGSNNSLGSLYSRSSSFKSQHGFQLLQGLLEYDPEKRLTAAKAFSEPYFSDEPKPGMK
jgi:serine/threonine protein kinase